MKLRVMTPAGVLVDQDVRKVGVEAEDGAITLLERHQDLATALVPGILGFETADGGEAFLAVAEATLVKCGEEVLVSARRAVPGPDLGDLQRKVEQEFQELDEREEAARTALAKIEATFVHRFIELEHGPA